MVKVRYFSEMSNDFIDAGDGNDSVFGGKDDDILKGNTGIDILLGDIGNDSICGGEDNDVLIGGNGDDLLDGDIGNDTLTGGAGADMFVLGQNYGAEVITDFSGTDDLLILGTSLSFQQLSLSSANNSTLIRVAGSGELLATLQGVDISQIGEQNFMMV
ncbi:MAG TPA: hypothetical protein V6D13_16580 [Halomicronema sp.]